MNWRTKLTPSSQAFLQEIAEQLPPGTTGAFETILNQIAGPEETRFAYIILPYDDDTVFGTDDAEAAERWEDEHGATVIEMAAVRQAPELAAEEEEDDADPDVDEDEDAP
jgi:hypothetical protein